MTPAALLRDVIQRIESANTKINAVIGKVFDQAESRIARGLPDGSFKGVPGTP